MSPVISLSALFILKEKPSRFESVHNICVYVCILKRLYDRIKVINYYCNGLAYNILYSKTDFVL